jgi:hypothetical protein
MTLGFSTMTSTARRRWSRELDSEVDGMAFSEDGPILVHVYDPPAGGMWIDEVIPGKLGAIDRNSGEVLWTSPCEVGYGRGFGAGFGSSDEIIVLGPSSNGHRIVSMSAATGELLSAEPIDAFDEAIVSGDVCICSSAGCISAISTSVMKEAWRYTNGGQRFHQVRRRGDHVLVLYSDQETKQKGVLALDVLTGSVTQSIVPATLGEVHAMAIDKNRIVLLTADVAAHLPNELAMQFLDDLSEREDPSGDMVVDTLTLLGFELDGESNRASWYEILSTASGQSLPDVSLTADSGKLYVSSGALVGVRDMVSGRVLGDWTIPGLDERVSWQVSQGAGLLAEEHRISVFELPA